jgi:oxaloacetate decarboxylase alpha subunit
VYTVTVNGQSYVVEVSEGGDVQQVAAAAPAPAPVSAAPAPSGGGEAVKAPLAGNIFKVNVAAGDSVDAGQVIVILEAMKMETEVRAPRAGTVSAVSVSAGDAVAVGDTLITLG